MDNPSPFEDVAQILHNAERALERCGPGLRFQVTPDSGLRIVRRLPPVLNQPASYEPVADLDMEPALWLIHRPEGRYCLLLPLGDPNTTESGNAQGSVELYFDGMPLSWSLALTRAPLLAALYRIGVFLWHVLPGNPHAAPDSSTESPL